MLILLDIDGVMVSGASWRKPEILEDGFPAFGANAIKALQKIISKTGANIVLTTSHKLSYTIPEWHAIFKCRFIEVDKIDRLPTDTMSMSRKDEILQWYGNRETSECFVIIDDDTSLNDLPLIIKEKLVLSSSIIGLTDELALAAISILEKQATH